MDMTEMSDPLQKLEASKKTAIADLDPQLSEPATRAIHGVITIIWPYNSVKNTVAFILAEPDFRLRRNKGQVRINFSGQAAKVVGASALGSNDEVTLSLKGAGWEAEEAKKRQSLPGASLDWQLSFSDKILLKVKSGETGETRLVTIQDACPDVPPPALERDEPPPPPPENIQMDEPVQLDFATLPPAKTRVAELTDGEFESPAFLKRARMSYGSLFEGGFDIFEDDGGARGRGRKRSRFGRDSGAWRYTSQSPSPEPVASPHSDVSRQDEEQPSSPTRPEMADESCQTMELDIPSPAPMPVDTVPANAPETTDPRRDQAPEVPEVPEVPEKDPTAGSPEVLGGHGILETPQNGWMPAPPDTIPSFANSSMMIDTSSKEHSFPNPPTDPATNFGHIWDSTTAGLASEDFAKAPPAPQLPVETFPSGSVAFSTERPSPFDVPRSRSRTHSPGSADKPDIYSAVPIHNESSKEPLDHEGDHRVQPEPIVHYPSLDVTHEVETEPIPHDSLTDYPSSYLDDNQHPSHVDMGQPSFNQGFHAVTGVAPTSWATVNIPSQATAMPITVRLDSAEGSTPNQAVVIDESDSDEDSEPNLAAVEDNAVSDRVNTLDVYEDTDVEDDVDAQYSDEDDPEYDEDEIGDYDTRNHPDDDEDDSHDEDLKQPELEPEFGDEESYEEEEDNEDLEYESDYEMDTKEPQRAPQHVTPSNPTVIDLISSSEDEGEEDDSGHTSPPAAPTKPIPNSVSQHQQLVLSNNMPDQSPKYGPPSGIDGGRSDHQFITSDVDEPSEDEEVESELEEEGISIQSESDGAEDEEEEGISIQSESDGAEDEEEEEDDDNGENSDEDEEGEEKVEEEDESSSDEESEASAEELEETGAESIPMHRPIPSLQQLPEPNLQGETGTVPIVDNSTQESTGIKDEGDAMQLDEEPDDVAIVPMSAADGLEILSRAVENESSGQGHPQSAEHVSHTIIDNTFETKETPMATVQALDREHSEDSESVFEEVDEGERFGAGLQASADHATLVPVSSSSQSTQPATSREVDNLMEYTVRTTSIIIEAQGHGDQLPTPRDTQMTDMVSFKESLGKTIEIDVSREAGSMEINNAGDETVSISTESSISSNEHDTSVEINQGILGTQPDAVPDQTKHIPLEADHESEMEPVHSPIPPPSPNPIIQVNNDDITQTESFEETPNPVAGVGIQGHDHVETGAPGISLSFQSQMEGDEELQASILENFPQDYGMDEQLGMHMLSEDQLQDQSSIHSEELDFDTAVDEMDTEQPGLDDETAGSPSSFVRRTSLTQPTAIRYFSPLQQDSLDSHMDIPDDTTDASSQIDPSVQLARAANSSKRSRRREATPNTSRPNTRSSNTHDSSAFDTEDSSVQLARASFTKSTKSEEDTSMTATKLNLVRHLRDELPGCTSLKVLRQHLTKTLDVIGIAMMKPPEPRRGKSGPREYMMSFTITDHSIGPHSVAEVQLYRPHKDTLPQVKPGDVVLLHNFKVMSLPKKGFGLRTTDGSSWAVFDHEDEPAQIKGPPVEYGDKETMYVAHLREWFGLLDERARAKLEQANQKIIGAGRAK
ncbi:hypothetical protein F4809DRAFT_628663 [Biscogniauxia mediterranea]|nr:hypothetical protein F4809DRAFT_628663 [Biscogniauxia mediterranea]